MATSLLSSPKGSNVLISQVMGRTLSSLKEDEAKLAAELQEKQIILTTFSEGMDELKAKQERAALQVCRHGKTGYY